MPVVAASDLTAVAVAGKTWLMKLGVCNVWWWLPS